MSITIEDVIEYDQAVITLAKAKKKELELRNKIIESYRFSAHEGVQHRSISSDGIDYDISITLKMNRNIDKELVGDIWGSLTRDQQDAIEYVPKIVMKNYKELVKNDQVGQLAKAITEKQGQATVKLKLTELL